MSPPLYRADHTGSYLRPKDLAAARKKFKEGEISAAELRKVEDVWIEDLVKKLHSFGLAAVTDGEFRRETFHLDFLVQLDGITVTENNLHTPGVASHTPPVMKVTGRIKHVKPIQLEDFLFLKSISGDAMPKVSIPSPTMAHFRAGRAGIPERIYPDLKDFYEDLTIAYRAEIQSLYDAGCRYIQLDDTNLAYLCDPKMREASAKRGDDPDALPKQYAELINSIIRGRPDDLQIGMHLCRGNFKSTFFSAGGYEPIAQTLFSEIEVDVLFLEWDTERAGGFEPLRFLPPHRHVVLGLVSSKVGELEDKEVIKRRIYEAATFAGEGLEQLSLSTQCGFASTHDGNNLTEDEQWAKMKFIREITAEVWPSS